MGAALDVAGDSDSESGDGTSEGMAARDPVGPPSQWPAGLRTRAAACTLDPLTARSRTLRQILSRPARGDHAGSPAFHEGKTTGNHAP